MAAAVRTGATLPPPLGPDEGSFLNMLDARRRKEAQALLPQLRQCLELQSKALHVHAYTLAGTRIWALAAGREAMTDKRLLAEGDVFFYELEEMKQMMTGEWNISATDNIRATAGQRQQEYQAGSRRSRGTCSSATARRLPLFLAARQACPAQADRGVAAWSAGVTPASLAKVDGGRGDPRRRTGGYRLGGGPAGRRRHCASARLAARSCCRGRRSPANSGRLRSGRPPGRDCQGKEWSWSTAAKGR